MFARLTLVLCLGFAVVACERTPAANTEKAAPVVDVVPSPPPSSATAAATAEGHVHSVACACSLGQECSNMIEVDGEYVPLTGELGLGEMEFCGKTGLKARVDGELKDGSFVATSFELVK